MQSYKSPFKSFWFWFTTITATAWTVFVIASLAAPPFYWDRVFSTKRYHVPTPADIENERHHRAVEAKLQRIGNQLYRANEQREDEYYRSRWNRD